MMQLPIQEMVVFLMAASLCTAAAVMAVVQLRSKKETVTRLMIALVCAAVCLNGVVLIFRAVSLQAIPLTGLFESMLVLIIVVGLFYVLVSLGMAQIWFSAVMIWSMLGLTALAALVAEPAAPPEMVVTPWTVFHAISMLLSSCAMIFATATASLYLMTDHMLKHKNVMSVLGRVPNIGWLRQAHKRGLIACLFGMTLGLISGIGLAVALGWTDWMTDPKIVLIAGTWCLLILILSWHSFAGLSDRAMAYATIVMLFLVIFAVVGVAIFCGSRHGFTS
ncbi:MAG: cytochrome c biogenesis protein CcsA [Planctomycetes bacterium]|nr:cytochrome c biogenesis protein CcsA [Planctomycetota bacterium]